MKFLINGEFIDKSDHYDVINPYNGEIVDTVPIAYRNDVDKAIESANNAKKTLNDLSAKEVSNNLLDSSRELEKEGENIAKLIVAEAGKPYKQAIIEIQRSVETLQFAAEEAKRIYGESVPIDASGSTDTRFLAFTKKVPLGVVGAISPFNYPVNLALHKIAPAIAAKNTVVMKPSMEAPLSALRLVEIINNHFPSGVINSVTGYGSEVGDAIVVSPYVNKISFTGSVATGLFISSRAGMKKLTLELGGNDPLVVLSDANIEKAVNAAVSGAFLFSGQVCIGVKRIILDNKIADEFIDLFAKKANKLKMGNPMDESTDIGPLINENAAINVEVSVNNAIENGAELILGGNRKDCFFEPTILDNVNGSMNLVAEETFGPIAPIIRIDGIDEAIKVANDTQYGLQAGVFTENIHSALRCANEIDAGSVLINKESTFRTDAMPFGGFKSSGIGKEGIKYAVEDMCKTKLIAFNCE
ncbi:lactaldehyde dehydrogenase [Methanobrevibacter olleyae]|uniref:Lactaldehyde dehydrogenase n=1 Tax=Methanobrevibacter olleyae TaxID=294671 RepID=A0A126QYI8_METOL|nr:lactaldehyde dehydrogenase [Methanobrevibacter olleyae]AMK14874.1 lactaldehyde dehydrogenase CofA [Methanobrevibacter olleyae]SFL44797.1 lactaldehyde dehydrogenase [Methanobrevibacter olleyae]